MRRLILRTGSPLESARHDVVVLGTAIAAVVLLIGNGTSFFREVSAAEVLIGPGIQVAAIALTLNVALILFGWRRYVDLQHETERRLDGERRAGGAAPPCPVARRGGAVAASTDPVTGLMNRKGFADAADDLRARAIEAGTSLLIVSLQLHRF